MGHRPRAVRRRASRSARAAEREQPPPLTPIDRLQQSAGNRAVTELLRRPVESAPPTSSSLIVMRQPGRLEKARQDFEEGKALYERHQYAPAAVRLTRALEVPGLDDRAGLLWCLAMCNKHLDRRPAAMQYLEAYLGEPGVGSVDRAAAETELEQLGRGLDAEAAAAEGGATDPAGRFTAAQSLYAAGQFEPALAAFYDVRTHARGPADRQIFLDATFNLAQCNLRLGRSATAIPLLEEYLVGEPEPEDRSAAERLLDQARSGSGSLTAVGQARLAWDDGNAADQRGDAVAAARAYEAGGGVVGLSREARASFMYDAARRHRQAGNAAGERRCLNAYLEVHHEDAEAQARFRELAEHEEGGSLMIDIDSR